MNPHSDPRSARRCHCQDQDRHLSDHGGSGQVLQQVSGCAPRGGDPPSLTCCTRVFHSSPPRGGDPQRRVPDEGCPQGQENEATCSDQIGSGVNELPSVALTTKFLELCQQCGSEQLAVRIVAAGRSTGVPGLPQSKDWTAWNADEMRAAVEHLQHKLSR